MKDTFEVNLGYLGSVKLEPLNPTVRTSEGFVVTHSGYTKQGIRVHGSYDVNQEFCWKNSLVIPVVLLEG